MDNEKKEVLIGIDVFLWIIAFIPGAVYVTELIHAYRDGVNIAGFSLITQLHIMAGKVSKLRLTLFSG